MCADIRLPEFADHGRNYNGSQTQRRQIGVYHHRDAGKSFDQPQEVAAWHRRGTFPVGDYPVYEYRHGGNYFVLVELTGGIVTSASFPSLFGGVPFGRDRGPEEVGNPFDHAFQLDSFGVANADPCRFTFSPGINIRRIGEYSDGRPMLRAFDFSTDKPIGR